MHQSTKHKTPNTKNKKQNTRSLPSNVWVLTLTSFLTDVSSEMLVWLIPLFLTNVLGARTAAIGLIEGSAETAASLLKVVSGWLSDVLGRRKSLAVAGYAISTLAKPCLLLVSSWPGVLAVRVGDRLGKGIRTAPRDALLADSTAADARGLAFGIHRAGDTAGAFLGVLIALLVVWWGQGKSNLLSPGVFRTLVIVSVIPAVLAVVCLASLAREVPRLSASRAPGQADATHFSRRFRVFLAIMIVFTLGNSADAFLVLRAQQLGLPVLGVLGMVLSFNLVYSVLSTPAGMISDRVGRRRVLTAGWIVYALIYLGFAQATAGWQAWTLMTLYGAYFACSDGVAKAFVADLVPSSLRGTAYGVYHTSIGLAALPASLIAGILWDGLGPWPGWGPSAPFYFGAILAALASLGLAALLPDDSC
jgi:MFS family permease